MHAPRGKEIPGMFEGPVLPLTLRIGMPILISSAVQFIYAIADTYFISRIDPHSTALLSGTGLMFPIFFFFMALAMSVSVGVSALVGRGIGEGKKELGGAIMASGLLVALCVVLPMLVAGYVIGGRFVQMLAGPALSQEALSYGLQFFHYLLPGLTLMIVGQVFMGVLQGEGLTGTIAGAMMLSTATNIILDPILIFGAHMGVAGAGLATTLSVIVAMVYTNVMFLRGKSGVALTFNLFKARWTLVKEIIRIGFPHFLSMASLAVSFVVFNKIVSGVGQTPMNAWTLAGRMDQLILMPSFAIAGATVTIVAQNYGRRNRDRIREVYKKNLLLGVAVVGTVALAYALVAPIFFRAFTAVNEVVDLAALQVRIMAISYAGMSVVIVSSSMFQASGRPILALVVSIVRMGVISIPLALVFVFVFHFGFVGVVVGLAAGNLVAVPVAVFWALRHLRTLKFRSVGQSSAPSSPGMDIPVAQ